MTTPHRLQPGDSAPDFTLLDQDGTPLTLSSLRGTPVILYTYPKAFTPGCTTEACDFRDADARLVAAGYRVLAISADPVDTLKRFATENKLPFTLLSDPDHTVQTAYGAFGEKKNYGKTYIGAIRSTFVIDADGKIVDALVNVRASGHVDRILKLLAR